jgi:putative phosphoribosyl transferase
MSKKIGAPFNPEYAVAAVDPAGEVTFADIPIDDSLRAHVMQQVNWRKQELAASLSKLRAARPAERIANRTVFVVDDGLATGLTAMAAVKYVRRQGLKR